MMLKILGPFPFCRDPLDLLVPKQSTQKFYEGDRINHWPHSLFLRNGIDKKIRI